MKNDHHYFCNKECEYYPCHQIPNDGELNCLFCFCPLYSLGDDCGGNFNYVGDHIKDCSNCIFPHLSNSYSQIIQRLSQTKR